MLCQDGEVVLFMCVYEGICCVKMVRWFCLCACMNEYLFGKVCVGCVFQLARGLLKPLVGVAGVPLVFFLFLLLFLLRLASFVLFFLSAPFLRLFAFRILHLPLFFWLVVPSAILAEFRS